MSAVGISSSPVPVKSDSFSVKVSKNQEHQQEKVVGKLIDSISETSPSRDGFNTGQSVNIKA